MFRHTDWLEEVSAYPEQPRLQGRVHSIKDQLVGAEGTRADGGVPFRRVHADGGAVHENVPCHLASRHISELRSFRPAAERLRERIRFFPRPARQAQTLNPE